MAFSLPEHKASLMNINQKEAAINSSGRGNGKLLFPLSMTGKQHHLLHDQTLLVNPRIQVSMIMMMMMISNM